MLVKEGVWGAGADAARDEEDIERRSGVKGVGWEDGLGEGGVEGIHGRAAGSGGDGVEGRGDEGEFKLALCREEV